MRKIKFNKWIPSEYETVGKEQVIKEGTNQYSKDFPNEGILLSWGISYEGLAEGVGHYTVGIIEDSEGFVHTITPSDIKFEKD